MRALYRNRQKALALGLSAIVLTSMFPVVADAVTVDIKANGSDGPLTIASGSNVIISWNSDAVTCKVYPNVASYLALTWGKTSGSETTGKLGRGTYVYTASCVGADGTTGIDTVTVNAASAPVITTGPTPTPTGFPTPTPTGFPTPTPAGSPTPTPSPTGTPPPANCLYTSPPSAPAGKAALFLSPACHNISTQMDFFVDVYLNTGGRNVNTVTAVIAFDPNKTQLIGVDSANSAFPGAADETVEANRVKITRFKTPPAVNGSGAFITRLRFRLVAPGPADINIAWGGTPGAGPSFVLDQDNGGQDILGAVYGSQFTLTRALGDLDLDGRVNATDLGMLLSTWGSTLRPPSDINRDGRVDAEDLGILLSGWTG